LYEIKKIKHLEIVLRREERGIRENVGRGKSN
jgi:hypothetical protein